MDFNQKSGTDSDDPRYHLRKFGDRKILAHSDIQQVGPVVILHQETRSIRQVIEVEIALLPRREHQELTMSSTIWFKLLLMRHSG